MKHKVFVTGADGMLGTSICNELIRRGYKVKRMVLPDRSLIETPQRIETVYGNILDANFLEKEIAGCHYVIHTAALTTVWPRRSQLIKETNIEGTRNLMLAAEKYKVRRFIHIGTASSFRHGTLKNPGTEKNDYNGWKYRMDYMDSKYIAQKLLLERFATNGFPVIIINPTYMIGPFDSGPSSGKLMIELLKDNIPGYSPGGKNFVCACDVATAAVNSLESGRIGECYIVGNENLFYKEFFRKVCKVRRKQYKLVRIPVLLVMFIGLFNSVRARLFSVHPGLSYSMARFSCLMQFYSSRKAREELHIQMTPIESGIDSSLKWFEANGYID
ncbi:MAG TPA: NAD-dependent epimerase/dehydratase family protein [Bacteroidales bacterium]|nr:NAD-dependent epimerase/dehydratase family protein [Bacteroidales bacterium]